MAKDDDLVSRALESSGFALSCASQRLRDHEELVQMLSAGGETKGSQRYHFS